MNRTSKDIAHLAGASAPRVLIVEDEADLALLISYNLEAEGYVVESVARGDEAELRLAENAPDLVILDWMLPACQASRFVGDCGRGRQPGPFRSSW
jgi:two-component system, OmpR family, phosphate regulon response regulator PhoB